MQKNRRQKRRKGRKVYYPPQVRSGACFGVLRPKRFGRVDHGDILPAAPLATYFGRWKSRSADGSSNEGRFDSQGRFNPR
jgi:hypothetical protein